jgi:hypothetical protein
MKKKSYFQTLRSTVKQADGTAVYSRTPPRARTILQHRHPPSGSRSQLTSAPTERTYGRQSRPPRPRHPKPQTRLPHPRRRTVPSSPSIRPTRPRPPVPARSVRSTPRAGGRCPGARLRRGRVGCWRRNGGRRVRASGRRAPRAGGGGA